MLTDGNTSANKGANAALIVGKITPERGGLFEALKQIRNGQPMQLAVLLLFSQDMKGKIGVANNRVITGAFVEGSGEVGQSAIDKLFKADRGMFGVREADGTELIQLHQKLLIDIDQLFMAMQIDVDSQTVTQQLELDMNDVDPGYLEWMQAEKKKVFEDLDRSLDMARASAAAVSPTNTFQAAPQAAPQQRPQQQPPQPAPALKDSGSMNKWEGLDDIPTPTTLERRSGQNDTRPTGSAERRTSSENILPASTKISTVQQLKTSGRYKQASDLNDVSLDGVGGESTLKSELENIARRRQIRIGIGAVAVVGICAFLNFMITHHEVTSVFSQANGYFVKGEYREAVFLLTHAIAKDPNNGRLHMQLGLAFAKLGEHENALKEFDIALAKGAPRLPGLLARATTFSDTKQFDKAIAECAAILVGHKDCIPAYLLLATAYDHSNNPEAAEKACSDGLKNAKSPEDKARLLMERGYALARMHREADAERDLSAAIELQPTPAMYMARGDVYKRLGKYKEATADYSAVIEKDPQNYNALVARGIAQNYDHQDEAALKDFAEALKVNKRGVEALIQRGSLYLSRRAYRLAVNDLEDALKLNPSIAETQQKLDAGYKHLRITTPKKVLALEENAAAIPKFKMPTEFKELIKVGYKYLNDGELSYAIACFAQAVKLNPADENARKYLAHAMFEAGDANGAATQFEALNHISGVDDADILPFSQSLARSGRVGRAIQVLESYLQENPRAVSYRCDLANLYFQQKQTARAKQVIAAGLRYPTSATDRERLTNLAASFDGNKGSSAGGGTAPAIDNNQ